MTPFYLYQKGLCTTGKKLQIAQIHLVLNRCWTQQLGFKVMTKPTRTKLMRHHLCVQIQQNQSVTWTKRIPLMILVCMYSTSHLYWRMKMMPLQTILDSSDSTDSSGTYISGSEFNESARGDLSDNDSCSSTSDEEIEKSDDAPTASASPDFTSN